MVRLYDPRMRIQSLNTLVNGNIEYLEGCCAKLAPRESTQMISLSLEPDEGKRGQF